RRKRRVGHAPRSADREIGLRRNDKKNRKKKRAARDAECPGHGVAEPGATRTVGRLEAPGRRPIEKKVLPAAGPSAPLRERPGDPGDRELAARRQGRGQKVPSYSTCCQDMRYDELDRSFASPILSNDWTPYGAPSSTPRKP